LEKNKAAVETTSFFKLSGKQEASISMGQLRSMEETETAGSG